MKETKTYPKQHSVGKALLIGGSASVLMSLFTPSVLAAEVSSVINANKQANNDVEVIEVSGVRGSLESALREKRGALSIVDAISAKDMDALPALDLGEAMQAIPGVQLNTDDSGRNSEITLRGLPGGFAKTMAEGQSFAVPSLSRGAVGESNPFGAFEASTFDGVTVIKAPTADLQEGGMAGVVNKKLQRALGSRDGKYSIGLGGRWEELTDDWNKTIKLSASKHIIKNKLAVAFKVAGSEQNFRSDTANFTEYVPLNSVENNLTVDSNFISRDDLNAYKTQHGINDPLSVIKAIGKAHQVSVHNRGNRVSATANIEWKPTDSLKLGANFLYTLKKMDESNMEDAQFQVDTSGNNDTQRITPLSTPIRLDSIDNPDYRPGIDDPTLAKIPQYAVTHTKLTNVNYRPVNRLTSSEQEAKGVFIYANYATDDWVIDATATRSNSVSENVQSGFDFRLTNSSHRTYTDLDGLPYKPNYAPTGLNAEVKTGEGDLKNASATITGLENYNFSDVNNVFQQIDPVTGELMYDLGDKSWQRFANGWQTTRVNFNGSKLDPKINPANLADYPEDYFYNKAIEALQNASKEPTEENIAAEILNLQSKVGGKSVDFYTFGRVQRPTREMKSAEINFERYTDIGSDAFRLTSVKFGSRHSRETLEAYDRTIGGGGINMGLVQSTDFFQNGLTSDRQNEYFNGDYPKHFRSGIDNGWLVINSQNMKQIVQTDMVLYDKDGNLDPNLRINPETGFAERLISIEGSTSIVNQQFRQNFYADQAINAAYLMGKFEGELAGFTYTGNAGLRYVSTSNDVIGSGFNVDGNEIAVLTENNYEHTLPSLNLAIDVHDDVVLRTAYSQALVRPNLLAQSPSPIYTYDENRVTLENSKAEVLPYTSNNFDLSLAWYNRDGSSISGGFFYKEIEGQIVTDTICPVGDPETAAFWGVGEVAIEGSNCKEVGEFVTDEGEIYSNRIVKIKQTYNSDIPVKVFGYEFSMQQKLDFLPYPWNGFGGKLNFSKIDVDEGAGRAMTRIAPYTSNLIGYWENNGASIQLVYNWQDEKLLSTGQESGTFLGTEARTQTAGGRIDLSARYKFRKSLKGLTLNLKAMNVNNREEYEYIAGNDKAISRIRYQGRIVSLGLSYSF
ncbi:TonB-dependent receptor domain-containing protein [Catenovulum maritimum]|uniref:Rhodanese n=1 Tax=Catenovulum maritimum TaxID=1513271 RepID=A0A0J8GWG1_9ALTE|nr:TonB-dependent receptor [Catenovulum maritimum]KMT67097.1 rhodanese [Catenovulum maritimum]